MPPTTATSRTTLDLSQLEAHLWEAANILRGPVDAADFKTYVFPLLFFKRLSDVHDEEYDAALAESGGDEEYALFPQNYRFQVPEGCHWRDVRAVTTNVGQALQKALRGIERANPDTLYGIFGDAQWTNKERLSDALLRDLVEHFSRISLGNQAGQADILGQSYEYLIKKFADATNKKAGEFYTPRPVVRLMVNILDPHEGESIYDPACGTGGMLLEAIHHVRERHGDDRTLWGKLFGQEKNLTTSAIARMNLFLHGAADFQVVRGDTLRNPAFFLGDNLATFDCVIANPPFSLEKWGSEVWASDPYGRNFAGMPPDKTGDYAWVQHMVKSMAPKTGRMAVVLPHVGIDYGKVHIVEVGGELTVVGTPVVYACRMAGTPANTTAVNQPAYERLFDLHPEFCDFREAEIDVKHEGKLLAHLLTPSGKDTLACPPPWLNEESTPDVPPEANQDSAAGSDGAAEK